MRWPNFLFLCHEHRHLNCELLPEPMLWMSIQADQTAMVKKQGRGSNVVLIETAQKRIGPPSDLNSEEVRIFESIVGSCAPSHFIESDKPLLTAYCTAVHLS